MRLLLLGMALLAALAHGATDRREEIIAHVVDPCWTIAAQQAGATERDVKSTLAIMKLVGADDMDKIIAAAQESVELLKWDATFDERKIVYDLIAQACIQGRDQPPEVGKSLSAEALPKRRFVADREELCGLVEDNVEARRKHGHAATEETLRIMSLQIRCLKEGLPRGICNEMEDSDEYQDAYFSFLRSTDTINDYLESRCLDERNTNVARANCVVGASQFPNRHIKRLSYVHNHVLEQGLTREDALKLAEKRAADLGCDVLPLGDDTHNSLKYAVYHVWK